MTPHFADRSMISGPAHDSAGSTATACSARMLVVSGLLWTAIWSAVANSAVAGGSNEPNPQAPATTAGTGDLTPALLLEDLESGAREKQARLTRLRTQLQRLSEENRLAREQTAPPEQVPAHGTDEPPAPAVDADLEPLMPELAPSEAVPVPDPPDDGHHPPADGAQGGHGNSPAHEQTSHPTETVVGTSINRLALGDNLFGAGQTELALQAYSNIELLKVAAADRYWVEYQIANCHRRLGNIPEAQQRYRKLAGLVDAGWCAGHSRWWLDALDTRAELHRNLETVRNSLKSIEEQLNAQPSK